jgi:hypothetical protein
MRLHEINQANQVIGNSILIDEIVKYKKSLITYWSDMYCVNEEQLILVVTDIMNAAQYGFITEAGQYQEVVEEYVNTIPDMTEEDKENEIENINFNSIQLNKL